MLLVCSLAVISPVTAFAGWQKEGDTYAYYEDDGTRVVNAFRKSGNQWFYLDEDGHLLKNCEREIDGKVYVFNERGAVVPSAAKKSGGSKESADSDFSAISSRQQYLNKTANPYMNNKTVQWINATCAILTRHNAGNIRAFGGSLKLDGKEENGAELDKTTREQTRKMLKQSWGVTDRASADEALEELLDSAKDSGSAWDYSRVESNLGFYYLADYYTEKEALDQALEVAKEIQECFDSWDDFVDSYLEGYEEAEKLIACASRNLEHGKAFAEKYGIPKVYGSYGEMMTDSEVEAVYIATPNNLHYENCRMCLEAGKHVLCEKPFTLSTEQAQELFDLAEEKGLFIMEAFWIRFLPAYDKLRAMLRDGVIGEVNRITSQFGFVAEGARRERKFKSELGGGALLDIGIYNLGFFHMITETAPEGFQSEVHMTEYGTDDYSEIELEYPGGCSGHCIQAIGKQLDRNARIEGGEGVITIADFQFLQEFTVQLKDGTSYIVKEPFKINGFEYEIAETSRCVSRGMCTSDRYTKEDCLAVLRLMDDIRDSWDMIFEAEMEK